MDIIGMLKEMFGMTRAVSEQAKQRDAEKNAPDVKAAAMAQNQVNQTDQIRKDVADEDTQKIERDIADSSGPVS
jgi:hypothetical protein